MGHLLAMGGRIRPFRKGLVGVDVIKGQQQAMSARKTDQTTRHWRWNRLPPLVVPNVCLCASNSISQGLLGEMQSSPDFFNVGHAI